MPTYTNVELQDQHSHSCNLTHIRTNSYFSFYVSLSLSLAIGRTLLLLLSPLLLLLQFSFFFFILVAVVAAVFFFVIFIRITKNIYITNFNIIFYTLLYYILDGMKETEEGEEKDEDEDEEEHINIIVVCSSSSN